MLTPEYLEDLPDEILKLFSEAEQEILADMARRISTYDFWIPAADYQNEKLREAGVIQDDIIRVLSQTTRKSESELRSMMQEAGSMALHTDEKVYEAAGMRTPSIKDSKPLKAILNAGYKATAQEMKNICRTTARTATKQFEDALDRAWLKVSSGAFDAESAIRSAVKELSEKGIQSIKYPSGRTDSLEVSVRRAVVTGVNQTAGQLQEELADELGCDLVEVTAHAGARPEHAVWQGKIYSRSGSDPKYPPFRQSTGYGTGAGLCGWNCGHSFGPYIEGSPPVWTEEQLAELNAPKYEYSGKKLTEYEASQQQRYNERQIRRWKREETAMKAAGLDSSEAAAKVKEWQGRQQEFLAQTGFKRQYGREQISVANLKNRGIIEMYRKKDTSSSSPDSHFLSDKRFNQLTIQAKKMGAIIIRGSEEVERHLDSMNASAAILGDVLFFRKNVTITDVLEETYHFGQNLIGMNDDIGEPMRTILNEIDAKEYLLRVASDYSIPRKETESTQNELDWYRKQLAESRKGG